MDNHDLFAGPPSTLTQDGQLKLVALQLGAEPQADGRLKSISFAFQADRVAAEVDRIVEVGAFDPEADRWRRKPCGRARGC